VSLILLFPLFPLLKGRESLGKRGVKPLFLISFPLSFEGEGD